MENVNSVQPPTAPKAIDPPGAVPAQSPPARPAPISDTVEISNVAKLAAKVHQVPEVRAELIERVKAEIAAETYETPEKIEITADRLMEEFFPDL